MLYLLSSPASKTVENGSSFKTEMFITTSESPLATFTFEGKKLEKADNRSGVIKIKPSPTHFDANGLSKESWSTEVKVRKGMKDTTYKVTQEYFIRKKCD